VSDPRKNFCER